MKITKQLTNIIQDLQYRDITGDQALRQIENIIDLEDIKLLEIRLASNIEMLKNMEKYVLFTNQVNKDLNEDEEEVIRFKDVMEDLEDIRNELDNI